MSQYKLKWANAPIRTQSENRGSLIILVIDCLLIRIPDIAVVFVVLRIVTKNLRIA